MTPPFPLFFLDGPPLRLFFLRGPPSNPTSAPYLVKDERSPTEKELPALMSWAKSAKTIFETLPQPRKIFIVGDNDEVIEKFVTIFGKEKVSFDIQFLIFSILFIFFFHL